MFASLPMYDRAETRAAHDRLWAGIRDRLGFGPPELCRDVDYAAGWGRPDLILGQICNLPYRAHYKSSVTRIGTSDYGLPDTPPGYYHSVFVVRRADAPRGLAPALLGRFAFNDEMSQSGWGAPCAEVTRRGLRFHSTRQTGSHRASMDAVLRGEANLAAIDAQTWRMARTWDRDTDDLAVVGRTGLSPGQTFITAAGNDPVPIRTALRQAIAALSPDDGRTLGLRGIVDLPDRAFDLPLPAAPAPQPA